MWQEWLVKFLVGAGIAIDGEEVGRLVGEAISVLIKDLRAGLYTPDVTEYAFLIAAGVITKNPTMTLQLQSELVEEGIRILMLNPNVKQAPEPISVKSLAIVSLLRAGFTGPLPMEA